MTETFVSTYSKRFCPTLPYTVWLNIFVSICKRPILIVSTLLVTACEPVVMKLITAEEVSVKLERLRVIADYQQVLMMAN